MGKAIIVEICWSVEKQVSAVTGEVSVRISELIEQVLNLFPSLIAGKLGFCSARHLSFAKSAQENSDNLFGR